MSYAFPDTDFDRTGTQEGAEAPSSEDVAESRNREAVTSEPELTGDRHDPRFPDCDWLGSVNLGGGAVPADLEWRSNSRGDRLPERDSN